MHEPVALHARDARRDRQTLTEHRDERALLPRDAIAAQPDPEVPAPGDATCAQLTLHQAWCDLRSQELRLVHRQATLGEVPDALLPVTADDHHLALGPQDLEHHPGELAVVVPPAGAPPVEGAVLQLARAERSSGSELAKDVPTEGSVRMQPVPHVRVSRPFPSRIPPHHLTVDRVVGRRDDVGPELEQRAFVPQQSLELGHAEPPTEPAEQHEVLGASHRSRRVHLHLAELADHLQDGPGSGCSEELAGDREPPGPFEAQFEG